MKQIIFSMLIIMLAFLSCEKDNDETQNIESTVFSAAGSNSDLSPAIAQFRSALGEPLNTTPGATGGRREINWDAVPATFTNNNNFPPDFFNNTDAAGPNGRKRGFIFANNGATFRVDSTNFSQLEATYSDEFVPFSATRTIIAANSNICQASFQVPGAATNAFVKGFGVIFCDVDDANSTTLEFYNGNKKLGSFKAPAAAGSGKFSFLGVHFPYEKITRVTITAGNGVLGAGIKDLTDGGAKDIVVIDDFFYDEPKALTGGY